MGKKNTLLICSLAFLSLMGCKGKNELTVPVNLRTEYLREPIGLDTKSPRFTWEYKGGEKNFLASRSEIRIGTSPDNLQPYTGNMILKPHTRYYWNVTVWDQDGEICETSETATFETAKLDPSDWSGKWITDSHDKEFEPAPMFRKTFTLGKEIEEARVYVAAAGYYDLFINGKRVGENYLDPGYTHFDKRILYVTHDVTPLLKKGENAVASVLGNGWHNIQSKAVWDFETARWRNRPRMLCELRLRYTDGTTEVIATDESWRTATGPYTYNNIYSGDKYDATLEENGWNTNEFDDSKWAPVQVTEAPAPLLVAQQMPGIRITEELSPVSMKKFSDKLLCILLRKELCRPVPLKSERRSRYEGYPEAWRAAENGWPSGTGKYRCLLSPCETGGGFPDGRVHAERNGRRGSLYAFIRLSRFSACGGRKFGSRNLDKGEFDRIVYAYGGRARRFFLLLQSVVEQDMEGDNGSLPQQPAQYSDRLSAA